jgi:hypothetical protein
MSCWCCDQAKSRLIIRTIQIRTAVTVYIIPSCFVNNVYFILPAQPETIFLPPSRMPHSIIVVACTSARTVCGPIPALRCSIKPNGHLTLVNGHGRHTTVTPVIPPSGQFCPLLGLGDGRCNFFNRFEFLVSWRPLQKPPCGGFRSETATWLELKKIRWDF